MTPEQSRGPTHLLVLCQRQSENVAVFLREQGDFSSLQLQHDTVNATTSDRSGALAVSMAPEAPQPPL